MMAQIARAARFAIATVTSLSGLRASRALMRGSAESGGAGAFATTRRARTQSGSDLAWVITSFVLLRRWWLRACAPACKESAMPGSNFPLRGKALGPPIRLLGRADEVVE